MNEEAGDLFAPLSNREAVGGYLFDTLELYQNNKLTLDSLLKRFLKKSEEVGGADQVITLVESDEGFKNPNFTPPEDWEKIKNSIRALATFKTPSTTHIS